MATKIDDAGTDELHVAGVTAADVQASIEMILGRTPDQALVDYHVAMNFPDRVALGRYMLSTAEFEQRYLSGAATSSEPLGYWQARAHGAELRRKRLKSFGPRARGLAVSTDRGLFVVDPEDGFVAHALLHSGSYSSGELDFDISLVSPGSEVLVVGTHIGALAIPLAEHCRRVTAIEANPDTFELLQANVRLSAAKNIELHNIAVGEEDGREIEFVLNRDNSGGSKIKPIQKLDRVDGYLYDDPRLIRVSTTRLDTLLAGRTFDFIIVDIEGSEVFALRGMPTILAAARTMAIEFRPHSLTEVAGVDLEAFLAPILPHFAWMYLPREGIVPRSGMYDRLLLAFHAGTCYDAIYFFKEQPAGLP